MTYEKNEFVKLTAFATEVDASVAKSDLDEAGIPAVLVTAGPADAYGAPVAGSVELAVARSDVARAREILAARIPESPAPSDIRRATRRERDVEFAWRAALASVFLFWPTFIAHFLLDRAERSTEFMDDHHAALARRARSLATKTAWVLAILLTAAIVSAFALYRYRAHGR